ncbi:MAG: glycosyltransferase family 4 protein [Candidatus Hermodarchaeota archaeon]|nr:glycosyltransferase family 4 protein [Candidatus Hermodarchaeota archaeon]
MKILMVVESHVKGAGGGPVYWAHLSDHLIRRGHQVQVISGVVPNTEFASPNTVGVIPVRADLRSRSGLTLVSRYMFRQRFISAVRAFVEEWSPDIIHTVPPVASEAALHAGKMCGIPVLASILSHVEAQWTYLESNRLRARFFQQLESRAIRRPFCRIICLTHHSLRVLQAVGIPEERLVHVPHAVDTQRFSSKASPRFRTQLGLPEDSFVIGYAGSLSREKGTDQLLEAMAQHADDPNLVLLVAGDHSVAARRRIDLGRKLPKVHFLGRLDHEDMPSFMASIDLFVIPSMTETLPTTLLEALATGVPVMATAVGGIEEFIKDRFGIVLAASQVEEIAKGLDAVLSQRGELAAMGKAGQVYVQQHHNWELASELTEGVYQACLKNQ